MKKAFAVFYMRVSSFPEVSPFARDLLPTTHRFIRVVECDRIEYVYDLMQGEVWSPHGEARALIESAGVRHTSMSIGDVALDLETLTFYSVGVFGWEKLPDMHCPEALEAYLSDLRVYARDEKGTYYQSLVDELEQFKEVK